jgi:hypothetical protein
MTETKTGVEVSDLTGQTPEAQTEELAEKAKAERYEALRRELEGLVDASTAEREREILAELEAMKGKASEQEAARSDGQFLAIHKRALRGFQQSGEILDIAKAQGAMAGRQLGLLNRRTAIFDSICARWSRLLQEMGKNPAQWPDDLEERIDALEEEMSRGPTTTEDSELVKLQELASKRPEF